MPTPMYDSVFSGERVGRYELVTRLSLGGMAELFLARLEGPGGFQKLVALKRILPDIARDAHFVTMFLDEAKVSAELNHPNLGQVFDLGQDPESGELFLAMEFIAGQTFRVVRSALAAKGERLPFPVTARVLRDVCMGLHAAHTHLDPRGGPRPVIHRDIKPSNVMLTFDGFVKLIDFGIAHTSDRQTKTQAGVVKGTASYMAPEQLTQGPITAATDVYAVGVMLHECLTGESLYAGQVPVLRLVEPPRPPSALNPEVTVALDAVCAKALAIDPSERFGSARELARALTDATSGVADDEALSELMTRLFPGQRTSLAQLADTAKDPRQSGVRLSKLAHQALQLETRPAATRGDATKGPVPKRVKAAAKTAPMQPAPVPSEEPQKPARRPSYVMLGVVLLAGAGGAAGVLHLVQRPTPLVLPPPVVAKEPPGVPPPAVVAASDELPSVVPVDAGPSRKAARPGRPPTNDPGVSPVALPVAARPEHAVRLLALRDQLDDVRGGDRSALEANYEALEDEALHPSRPGVFEARAKALEGEVRRTLEAQKLLDSLVNQLPTAPPAEE